MGEAIHQPSYYLSEELGKLKIRVFINGSGIDFTKEYDKSMPDSEIALDIADNIANLLWFNPELRIDLTQRLLNIKTEVSKIIFNTI